MIPPRRIMLVNCVSPSGREDEQICMWIQLPHVWKTAQAYQIMNLLKANRIYARTLPDEFNGAVGNERMMKMDSEVLWPIFVKARNAEQAIKVLSEEVLY